MTAYTIRGIYSDFKYHDVGRGLLPDAIRWQRHPHVAHAAAMGVGYHRAIRS